MSKLGQHWSYRFPVAFEPADTCRVKLTHAVCVLHAGPEALAVEVTTDPAEDQSRLEDVVEEHVKRFGFREELVFPWERAA
jgi:hypothetical protein